MNGLHMRLRAVCDLDVAEVREYGGRHEYDGFIQDLSPDGVRRGLSKMAGAAASGPLDDPYDETLLAAFENRAQVVFGDLEMHRRSPFAHLDGLDLACYLRDYAPAEERAQARIRHLAAWPQAVECAISSLDCLSAPVATALLSGVRGLAGGIPGDAPDSIRAVAVAAHARLTAHVARAATDGDPDPSLGADGLAALMGSAEGIEVDLGRLAERADAERDRLLGRLTEDCARVDASRPALEVARDLVRDHPGPEGIIETARHWTERAIQFTSERDLVPYHDGTCLVGPAPESRRWGMAMISTIAPDEPEGPSWFYITPPDPSWPDEERDEWLEAFSATTLPAITVHEVAPGHFSHANALRRVKSPVRRTLQSLTFAEGWAHYAEELCVEQGFLDHDPRFAVGVWLLALMRVTRLACAIGVHTAGMSVATAARRFATDTHLSGPAALAEASRATFDPTYGRYTWGKLEIVDLRERARQEWGPAFSLSRFHAAMMELGSPPLGLLSYALAHKTAGKICPATRKAGIREIHGTI